jgi:hypothetical protein
MTAAAETFWGWVEQQLGAPCDQVLAEIAAMTPEARAMQVVIEADARRRLSALPVERTVADTCSSCGLHMVGDVVARAALLEQGGMAICSRCGIRKSVEAGPVPPAPPMLPQPVQVAVSSLAVKPPGRSGLDPHTRKAALPGGAYGGGKRAPGGEIAVLGRFKVLQRTDGRYVVHETEQQGAAPFRFGPVFDDLNLAKWRVWWRVEGEKKTGLRVGQDVLCEGLRVVLLDYVGEGRAFVKLPTGMPQEVRCGYLQPAPPLPPPLPFIPYVQPRSEDRGAAAEPQATFEDVDEEEEIPF